MNMSKHKASSPLVSVVMPNFNCMTYITDALNSVWSQSFKDLEVIVVDDGSTDGSREWLAGQVNAHANLVLLHTDRIGPAAARNMAINKAKGKYIAFLDSDDTWMPEKLATQIAFHEAHPSLVMSFTNYARLDEANTPLGDGYSVWSHFLSHNALVEDFSFLNNAFVQLFRDNPVGTSTVVVSRESVLAVSLFDELLPSAEDIDLWLKLAAIGDVAASASVTTQYLVRAGSESSRFDDRMQALKMIKERFAKQVAAIEPAAVRHFHARLASALAQMLRTEKRFFVAFLSHCKAFVYAPSKQHFKAMMDLINLIPRPFY